MQSVMASLLFNHNLQLCKFYTDFLVGGGANAIERKNECRDKHREEKGKPRDICTLLLFETNSATERYIHIAIFKILI